jgi:hypothetical protein
VSAWLTSAAKLVGDLMVKAKLFLSAAATAALLGAAGMANATPVPIDAYDLNGNFADAVSGGPALTSSGGSLGASTYTFAAGNYLDYAQRFASSSAYSVEMDFAFTPANGSWSRIFNTSPGGTFDNGAYVFANQVNWYESGNLNGGPFTSNAMHEYLFTRDAGGINIYLDGVLSLSTPAYADSAILDPQLTLFHDNGGENAPGEINFARFYDGALTPGDAAYLWNNGSLRTTAELLGQQGAVPEPATWALMLLGFGGLGAQLRRRRTAAA